MYQERDQVFLRYAIPAYGLEAGIRGTVVYVHDNVAPQRLTVRFSTGDGAWVVDGDEYYPTVMVPLGADEIQLASGDSPIIVRRLA